MLGFGRALGETMAVTMVIDNNPQVTWSLYAPQYTMAAVCFLFSVAEGSVSARVHHRFESVHSSF